jgi:hypothetical protein
MQKLLFASRPYQIPLILGLILEIGLAGIPSVGRDVKIRKKEGKKDKHYWPTFKTKSHNHLIIIY